MIAHIDRLISQIMYPHMIETLPLVRDRVRYSLETMCEHEQRVRRSLENEHTFNVDEEMSEEDVDYEPNPQKVVHTFTNALGLGSIFSDKRITIKVGKEMRTERWMQCWVGERKGDSNDEWWYGAPSEHHKLSSFTALIPVSEEDVSLVSKAATTLLSHWPTNCCRPYSRAQFQLPNYPSCFTVGQLPRVVADWMLHAVVVVLAKHSAHCYV